MPKPKPSAKVATKIDKQRIYLSQTDVPSYSLEKALRLAQAIRENYGNGPAKPLEAAKALQVAPQSSNFKMLAGASIAYGFTEGGWNATQISLTPLAMKILKPKSESDTLDGKREALLKPRVIREFLTKYNDNPVPRDDIAYNVLEDLNVPKDRTKDVLTMILEGANSVGFLDDIKGKKYVNLKGTTPIATQMPGDETNAAPDDDIEPTDVPEVAERIVPTAKPNDVRLTRVFISHGKNRAFIDPIRELLKFGQLEAVVSAEKSTVSQPVTQKVMNDMRSCGAAIIHVDSERKLMDVESKEVVALNENVLIEIGAAMALYGERYILLVKDGVKLPSNLQGLFEVRYAGDKLDGNETIKLMNSINDMKTKPLPG
jgi:predicted nucleotide-binding protein